MTNATKGTRKASNSGSEDILNPRVNYRFWFDKFQKSLLGAIIEMIKNAFDWQSSVVKFITNESRTELRYIDDGRGMNAANRLAFISVGETTAGGDQSGTFGTGAQYLIFTYALEVEVRTAPEDEPDAVYVMVFTPEGLARAYSGANGIQVTSLPKSPKTWPHEHAFGTDIRYTLRDPSARSIHRGAKLAQLLSDRLDNVLVDGGLVLVDNERLPQKKLAAGSRLFVFEQPAESDPPMGRIKLEFYRPASKSSVEDLRMTDRSIGEVSFRDVFVKHLLTEDQKDMVPPLFLEGEVCGLITAGFLHEHVDESRDRYKVSVADDERVVELLRLLNRVEADVANRLGIKLRHMGSDETHGKEEIDQLLDRLQKRYNPNGELPPGYRAQDVDTDEPGEGTKRPPRPPRPSQPKLPRLEVVREEFSLGEEILIRLVVPEGSTDGFHFYLDQARAKVETVASGEVKLIASELGRGLVQAVNPQTGQSAKAEYEVVTERELHLSASYIAVEVGSHTTVRVINADKAVGSLAWKLVEGQGELKILNKGLAARFAPTQTGKASIVAFDSHRPAARHICDVRVTPRHDKQPPFRIRDQYFTVEYIEANIHSYRKPATIVKAGDNEVHRLVINQLAPGFNAARITGTLQEMVAYSTAFEFIKQFGVDWEEVDASDLESVMLEVQNGAAVLFEDMLCG